MVDIYRVYKVFVLPPSDPRDVAEVYIELRTPDDELPRIYGTSIIRACDGSFNCDILSLNHIERGNQISPASRERLRRLYTPIAKRAFTIWRLQYRKEKCLNY